MIHSWRGLAVAALALSASAGCVPLNEHRQLEEKCKEQERFIQKHMSELKEFQTREQTLTMQARAKEQENQLLRNRIEQSERARAELERSKGASIQPASYGGSGPVLTGGFKVNPASGGIVLENDVLFAPGKSELKASGERTLSDLIAKLNGPELSRYAVRVDGHTDSDPVVKSKGSNVDNWGLSAQRALAVLRYLEKHGIHSDRLFLAGFGSQRPLVGVAEISHRGSASMEPAKHGSKKRGSHETKHDAKHEHVVVAHDDPSKAQNRRVEIVLFERKL